MMSMKEIVSEILVSQEDKGGVKYVYYVACGGSYAAFYPAKAFLEKEAKGLTVGLYNSGEFINNLPSALGRTRLLLWLRTKGIPRRPLRRPSLHVNMARRLLG
jgi:fructoselysine-6-P-deglycase FrlB-like protein